MTPAQTQARRLTGAHMNRVKARRADRQDQALAYYHGIREATGSYPGVRELADALGVRVQSAQRLIDRLMVAGRLESPRMSRMRAALVLCEHFLAVLHPKLGESDRRIAAEVLGHIVEALR